MTQPSIALFALLILLMGMPPRYSVMLAALALLALVVAATFEPFWWLPQNSLVQLPDTADGGVDFGYRNEWVGLLDWVHIEHMIGIGLAIGLATAISFVFPRRRDVVTTEFRHIDTGIQLLWGLGLAVCAFTIAAWQLRGTGGAMQSHALLGTGALILGMGIWTTQRALRPFAGVFTLCALGLLAFSLFYYPRHVTAQAQGIADAAPLCLAVDDRFVQPRDRGDLSLLTLHKTARPYTQWTSSFNHQDAGLVLASDRDQPIGQAHVPQDFALHTWSIWQNGFLPFPLGQGTDTSRGARFYEVNCIPNDSFLTFETGADLFEATTLYHELRVPAAYHPVTSVGDLYISATAPDYAPSGEPIRDLFGPSVVEFHIGPVVDSAADLVWPLPDDAIDLTDGVFDPTVFDGNTSFVTRFEDGTIRSAIQCDTRRVDECLHAITYARGGRYDGTGKTIRTAYGRELLPQWREIEERLIGMLDDFIIADREATSD